MDISFCELRAKDVINACDGRKLGRVVDLVFCPETGVVKGIVAPLTRRSFFSKAQEVFIPWRCIQKLGEDVILVDIRSMDGRGYDRDCRDYVCDLPSGGCDCPPPKPDCGCPPDDGMPDCDHRCDKCMLFNCAHRWKRTR